MQLKEFEGKALKDIEDSMDSCILNLALTDENMWGSILGCAYRDHGAKAAALYVAGFLYATQHREMLRGFHEGFSLVKDASVKLKVKNPELADKLNWSVHEMEGWLAFSGDYYRISKDNREEQWPIKLGDLAAAQSLALGSILIHTFGVRAEGEQDMWSTSDHVIWSCAVRHLKEVWEAATGAKKAKPKRKARLYERPLKRE